VSVAEPITNLHGYPLFLPKKLVKTEYWEHCRLVAGRKTLGRRLCWSSADAKFFYCVICHSQHNYTSGSSSQLRRHVESEEHKKAMLELSKA
jgi:hypothetical protein